VATLTIEQQKYQQSSARLYQARYKGIVVSDEEMASLNIKRADFHGEWNYTIASSNQSREAVVS
jgi:hypothetical protein